MTEGYFLVLAGVGAGLCGSIAGLASLVSYPALLAVGLSPLAANVTNTTAMFGTAMGSALGSRRELGGQGARLRGLAALMAVGGAAGTGLLLVTPEAAFEAVVPWLVALGAALLLGQDRIRRWVTRRASRGRGGLPHAWPGLLLLVGAYGGYFGAGVGIILLAALMVRHADPLRVSNAVKNIGTGAANAVAAVAFAFLAPVDWRAALAVGGGAVVGSFLGPQVVRVTPERPLRCAIALAGFALAAYLAVG